MINVKKVKLKEILYLRNLFLQENNFQIRYNACHERGWTDSYMLTFNNEKIGYGSVMGNDRDTIFEYYLIPPYRHLSLQVFKELLTVSKAAFIECQSNDLLLTSLLYQYSENISSDTVLLGEYATSQLKADKVLFRERRRKDVIFEHKIEPVGEYVLELNNEIIATGGFLMHYNMPFADLYMEVVEEYRKRGFGSFLIQELKRECYLAGRVPAARTGLDNTASRSTLIKAGFKVAGFMLSGKIKA